MLYDVICADPPWNQKAGRPISGGYVVDGGRQIFAPTSNKSSDLPYSTMSVDEICKLRIPAADDCHLYLWATNKYLPDAFKVMSAWGFEYSTTIVWAKNRMGGGLGGAHRITTEFCLFGKKGVVRPCESNGSTWHNWKRPYLNGKPRHSAKPPEFYDMINRMYPSKKRLEMFARDRRDGWHCWGNEVDSDIEIEGAK